MNGSFAQEIIRWYSENKRSLPWRDTRDPYRIWLSEIILQQTRVKQGLPYYERFTEKFHTVRDLAAADIQEVLRTWQGLGYYSRARNLHKCANTVVEKYGGEFPSTYKELLGLPGIGPYTAAAISSFAFGKEEAVVDGNVMRVLSRYFGLDSDIASGKGQKDFRKLAYDVLPVEHTEDYNQGIMEFGAIQCTPGTPDCETCPISLECFARKNNRQLSLPVKSKKTKSRVVHFTYFLFQQGDHFLLKERKSGIWTGLYEYFLVEDKVNDPQTWLENKFSHPFHIIDQSSKKHILSHREILADFVWVSLSGEEDLIPEGYGKFNREQVEKLPKPILIDWHLRDVVDAG